MKRAFISFVYCSGLLLVILLTVCQFSCKRVHDFLGGQPDISELPITQNGSVSIPSDIDISDLLSIWKKVPPSNFAPQYQHDFEAAPRIVHEFSRAGRLTGLSSGKVQIWFGFKYIIPAVGKSHGGWELLRIQFPGGPVDRDGVEKLVCLKKVDESALSKSVVFHREYYSSDWDFAKKLVEGKPIPDNYPIVKDLLRFQGGGAYPVLSTAGTSSVVVHNTPFVKPDIRKNVPLYLRQSGSRMFGIQRTKTGNKDLPFEHITGIYYEFWRVR